MTREQILQTRWNDTDKLLKQFKTKYIKLNQRLKNDIQAIFDSPDINKDNIFQYAASEQKKKIDLLIEEWSDDGLLSGYFKYLANSIHNRSRVKNFEILHLLIYKTYVKNHSKLDKYENKLFNEVANTKYAQGQEEVYRATNDRSKPSRLPNYLLLSLLALPNPKGYIWNDYVEATMLSNADQIYRQAVIDIQQDRKPVVDKTIYDSILNAQRKRYLNINGDKISGDLVLQVTSLVNNALVEGYKKVDKNAKVRFIAEIDQRTTEMCRSLDEQVFSVNDWNTFQRYSYDDGRIVNYKIFGLVAGANLPPINNHFHWCRSTVTYQLDMTRDKLNKSLMNWNEKSAINKWESADFYDINRKMYRGERLNRKERRLVKNLYTALNKQPFYNSKNDEFITRVLQVDNHALQTVISQHPVGEVYEAKSFEAYSLKPGYNSKANVFFYVKGSKKARNMLEYNQMSNEAEVLYQYGMKFITRDYYTKGDKHYFLIEELE